MATRCSTNRGFNVCVLGSSTSPLRYRREPLPYAMDVLDEAGLLRRPRGHARLPIQKRLFFAQASIRSTFSTNSARATISPSTSNAPISTNSSSTKPKTRRGRALRRNRQTLRQQKAIPSCSPWSAKTAQCTTWKPVSCSTPAASTAPLPRLMNWELPPQTVIRQVHFTHIDDRITSPNSTATKPRLHPPRAPRTWGGSSPSPSGGSSISVVGEEHYFRHESTAAVPSSIMAKSPSLPGKSTPTPNGTTASFRYLPATPPKAKGLLAAISPSWARPAQFPDPFSLTSGVTIAVQSSQTRRRLAAKDFARAAARLEKNRVLPCP